MHNLRGVIMFIKLGCFVKQSKLHLTCRGKWSIYLLIYLLVSHLVHNLIDIRELGYLGT